MNTSPARVFKGKRMASRYGNERSTMRNVRLVRIDKENNLLLAAQVLFRARLAVT